MEHCDPKTLLIHSNIRATKKKVAVLGELIDSEKPVCAKDIHARLSENLSMDIVTVYRALTALSNAGIIREVSYTSSVQYYEIASSHNPVHPHFKCSICHNIECLPALDSVEEELISGTAGNSEVHEISITLTGICPRCLEEGA